MPKSTCQDALCLQASVRHSGSILAILKTLLGLFYLNKASKVQWPLCFAFSYVQPVTQHYRRKRVEELPLQQSSHHKNMTIRTPPTINYCLESTAAITLHFQLRSARYSALQTKNSIRIISAISPVTKENTLFTKTYCREAMHRATANRHLGLSAKRNGTQRRTKVSP